MVGSVSPEIKQEGAYGMPNTKTSWIRPALVIFVLVPGFSATAEEPKAAAVPSKADLTPETFPKLWSLVRPHAGEWRHLKVDWMTDVVAARKRAAAEDKPLVVCYTGGAGYNEQLGVCRGAGS